MPPKKRKAVQATPGSAKKVRIGESPIIAEDQVEAPSFSRATRASARQPISNLTQPAVASQEKTVTGTTQPTTPTNTLQRRPGRRPKAQPASTPSTTSASKSTIEVVIPKPRGRPQKDVARTTKLPGRPTTTSEKIDTANAPAVRPAAPTAMVEDAAPTTKSKSRANAATTVVQSPPKKRGRPKATVITAKSKAQTMDGVPDSDGDINDVELEHRAVEEEGHDEGEQVEERQYWLMKAEPESRVEKGRDMKFSIDDLKAADAPEAWDGVRNPVARNNMRAMRKGDLAFFYHSNCKMPGIVGIMRIVQEHSIDESAFDINHPYYDPKSDRNKPKWELVHVEFVQKFAKMLTLHELKSFAAQEGNALANMQMLKQSRLSVSSVQPQEWHYIMNLLEDDVPAIDSAQDGDEEEDQN